ncbi:MAG: hypothetical protein HY055_07135 [Magnetospirillum sp.]|nr:hypothetical protein [Magnetospirillum sp.]
MTESKSEMDIVADAKVSTLRSVQARLAEALGLLNYAGLEDGNRRLIQRLIHGADAAINDCMEN